MLLNNINNVTKTICPYNREIIIQYSYHRKCSIHNKLIIFSLSTTNNSGKQQNVAHVSVVLHTLSISPTCYWRRDKQIVTDAAIQFHRPSIDARNSRHSVCACSSCFPSRSSQPWNIQSTNIRFCVIASFIFFELRLRSSYRLIRVGRNDIKNLLLYEHAFWKEIFCDYKIGLWLWMNRDRPLILKPSFQLPKISFNFILTNAMALSCKDNFQGFSVIIWCQGIIKRNMKL